MISRTSEYALRIMACLALHAHDGPMKGGDIADETNIPLPYLSKITRRMVEAGLLRASKGHHGGFSLAKPAARITFADILEAVEGDKKTPVCVFGLSKCSDSHPCVLHHRWKSVRSYFTTWAKDTSLADVRRDAADS